MLKKLLRHQGKDFYQLSKIKIKTYSENLVNYKNIILALSLVSDARME
jgi:hypothetical protein